MFWRKKRREPQPVLLPDPVKEHVRSRLAYYYRLEQQQPLSEWQKGRKSALEMVWQIIIHK
jgi:hypothetical protein